MMNVLRALSVLLLLMMTVAFVLAGNTVEGSLFAAQCDDIQSATFSRSISYPLDVDVLITMQHEPGVWLGYEAVGFEFGRHITGNIGHISTKTTCESGMACPDDFRKETCFSLHGYSTQEGDVLVIALLSDATTCGSQGEHCGYHDFVWGYVALEEWQRVTRRAQ